MPLAQESTNGAADHSWSVQTGAFENHALLQPNTAGVALRPTVVGVAVRISNFSLIEKNFGNQAANELISRIDRIMAIEYDCQPGDEFQRGHLSYIIPKMAAVQIEYRNMFREEAAAQAITAVVVAASCTISGDLPIPVLQVAAVLPGETAPFASGLEVMLALARQKLCRETEAGFSDESDAAQAIYRRHMLTAADFLSALLDGHGEEYASPICSGDSFVELYKSLFVAGVGTDNQICSLSDGYRSVAHVGLARAVDEMRVSRSLRFLSDQGLARMGVQISADSAVLDHWWRAIVSEIMADKGLASRLYLEILPPTGTGPNPALLDFCREIRALGVHLVLDQFGAGGSSLHDILALQPDYIKIEPSFLWRAQGCDRAFQTLRHLIGFSHSLKAPAIITGVDSPQLAALASDAGGLWLSGRQFGSNRASYSL